MLKLRQGSEVPFPELLEEEYEVLAEGNLIIANVGTDKLSDMLQKFVMLHKDDSLFFILEIPEKDDQTGGKRLGTDVYYMDELSREEALTLLMRTEKLLLADGMSQFGFGAGKSGEEIFVGKYNVVTVCSKDTARWERFMESFGVRKAEHLVTAGDTFSEEHPGISRLVPVDGKTVYSIPEDFKEWGMYLGETKEE